MAQRSGLLGPHNIRRSRDVDTAASVPAERWGLLSSLTLSIGRTILRLKLEVGRAASAGDIGDGREKGPDPMPGDDDHDRPRREPRRRIGTRSAGFRPGQEQFARPHRQELTVRRRRNPTADNFWAALDPTEREALRSVATWRTFAAGARLMREGERADYVIVILGGRTMICLEEDGAERVIAERGLGQLVGERGALQVSVRSASVIAVETVRALVVRTEDFATFISAHPRVLGLVEDQVYDRLTEEPNGYRHEADKDALHAWPGDGFVATHSGYHPQVLNGENCTVILTDVVAFGALTRNDRDRHIIREALFAMTHSALGNIPNVWSWDDRGDGLLTIVPPSVPTAHVIERLFRELSTALEQHNGSHRESARIQLRAAINVGPVASDAMGVSGEAIIVAARLVDAPIFKEAIANSTASLGVIASTFVYESVIRHFDDQIDLTPYSPVQVNVKELCIPAWMKLFNASVAPSRSSHSAVHDLILRPVGSSGLRHGGRQPRRGDPRLPA